MPLSQLVPPSWGVIQEQTVKAAQKAPKGWKAVDDVIHEVPIIVFGILLNYVKGETKELQTWIY